VSRVVQALAMIFLSCMSMSRCVLPPTKTHYLEFLSGRCRPNTVLAVAYDQSVTWWAAELKRTA
jgi:hypothetical protein